MARVTFPRVKSLERLLSLLNFSREALTKLLTGSLSKAEYVGQSGHSCASLAAGTVNRWWERIRDGWKHQELQRWVARHCVQLVYFYFFFYLVWSHRSICKAALLFERCWWRWQLCTVHIPTETNMKIRKDIPNHFHLYEGKLVTKAVRVILSVCTRWGACNVYLSVKSNRHARTGLAGLPVPFAEYTAVGLCNFHIEVEHNAILILW